MKYRNFRTRGKQQGMVLLVGLILLVILTAISMIGFRNVTLSQRMTGNAFDRNTSLQSAESAGKEAVDLIATGKANTTNIPTGYYATPLTNGGNTSYWTKGDGLTTDVCTSASNFPWKKCSAAVGTIYANNAQAAQYVVELLSTTTNPGTPPTTTDVYRVTSRSTGGSGVAEVVLQTIFSRTY